MASIRKFQETNHETSRKTDYPSLHEIIKIEDEVRTALKSLKIKKERFREWTKSLGDSPKIAAMFQDFDARISQLAAKLEYLEKIRTQVARGEIAPHEIPLYVARARNDFDITPEFEIAPGEEAATAREARARKDDFPETESSGPGLQPEPVSASPLKPAIEIAPETEPSNPTEAMERSAYPESQFQPPQPEMVSEPRPEPLQTDLPEAIHHDEPATGELFETILEEQPAPETIAAPDVTEFTFVIEDTDMPHLEPAAEPLAEPAVTDEPEAILEAELSPPIPEVPVEPAVEILMPPETAGPVVPAERHEMPEVVSQPAAETLAESAVSDGPEASSERISAIQPEIAEKAIDSIFSRNMVLKKRSKITKSEAVESTSEGDADAETADSSITTPGETSGQSHRGWKKVAQSIPEAELAELVEEVHREEHQEPAGSETIPAPVDAVTKSVPEEKPFSKYIQPKLPEKLLKKQYHHYLAERNIPIPREEPDLADLDLESFESEDSPQTDSKREKIFSYKNIKSRFSFRRFKKSKEDKQSMETGKTATPKEIKTETVVKEPVSEVKTQAEPEKNEVAEDKSVLYLGIDLGTSETTIAASNGVVATVLSVMGRPKDFISQKLLKAEKLFGIDALRNKLAVTLYRPMEKGVIKDTEADLEAARELVKYVISLASPEKYEKVYAVIGAPARSSFANQQALVDAAREVVDAVMIVSEPFAVAYGEGKIYNSLVIDIGAGTTDICCLKGSMPEEEDQFTLLKAGDFIDNHLVDLISAKFEGAQVTKDLAKKFKEEFSFVLEPDRNAVVEITVQGKPTKIDITKDIREACESIVPELITCTKNIIANFNPEFQGELKENVLLAGGGSLIKNLGQYIERQLRALGTVKVSLVPNPIEAGAKGALALAKDLTDEYWRAL